MSYFMDLEQESRQDEAIEAVYLDGMSDGFYGNLPAMSEIIYLQGYCAGMEQGRKKSRVEVKLPVISTEPKEYPLLCGQCQYLNDGICAIKAKPRISNNYACDKILVDSPF